MCNMQGKNNLSKRIKLSMPSFVPIIVPRGKDMKKKLRMCATILGVIHRGRKQELRDCKKIHRFFNSVKILL